MRRLAQLILPLVVLVIGFAAGAWFSRGHRAVPFTAGAEKRTTETADVTPASAALTKRAFSTDEEMLTAIMSAVVEDEPLLRAHRLHDLLEQLGPAELTTLFQRAIRVEDRDRRGAVLTALLARWAEVDAAGATAAVRPYLDRVRARGRELFYRDDRSVADAVNQAWTEALPAQALADALDSPHAVWASGAAYAALTALGDGDPAQQIELLAGLPASRLRGDLCVQALAALAEKDYAAAEARRDLLTDPHQRAKARADILGKLTARDPAAGLSRLAALAPGLTASVTDTQIVSTVLQAAGKRDAPAALAAVDGLPEELRTRALGAVLVGWADEHPVDALEWAGANGVAVSDKASLITTALRSDRAKTLEWVSAQPVSSERDAMLLAAIQSGPLAERFALFDALTPEARRTAAWWLISSGGAGMGIERTEAWARDLPTGSARVVAIQRLAYYQVGQSTERIDTLADAWPAGPDRDAALSGVAENMAMNDPRRGLDFARRIGDPVERERAFESLASMWLYRDAPAARAWITGAPELSAEEKRVLLRQFDDR